MFKLNFLFHGRNRKANDTQPTGEQESASCAAGGTASADMGDGSPVAQQPLLARTPQGTPTPQRPRSADCRRPTKLKWFLFYRSFADAMNGLSDASRLRLYDAMVNYAFYGISPQFKGFENNLWILIKTRLDLNAYKATEKTNKTNNDNG